ncbi:MAG: hypothetical protein ACM3UU_03525 [Ignavibacteriales bacterium]
MKLLAKTLPLLMILIIMSTLVFGVMCYAATLGSMDVGNQIDQLKNQSQSATDANVENNVRKFGANIVYGIKLIGICLGTVMLVVFGIKWMTANPNKKSDLKEQAWNYLIGAALLFGCGPLAEWIYNLVTKTAV